MRSVVVQPEATQKIDDAFGWYEDKEPGLGFRFLHDLETAYAVFFEFDGKLAVVHSVFHCSRNPVEWQERLTPLKKIL